MTASVSSTAEKKAPRATDQSPSIQARPSSGSVAVAASSWCRYSARSRCGLSVSSEGQLMNRRSVFGSTYGVQARSREDVTAGEPAVAGAAGVGRDDEARANGQGSPQAGAQQVERRRVGVLAGLVGRDQREALALKLAEVVDALQLVELEGRAVGEAPDVAGGVVARLGSRRRGRTPPASSARSRRCRGSSCGRRACGQRCRAARRGGA